MMIGDVRIGRAKMRAVEREQSVDHEPGERQHRKQPHPLGDRAGERMSDRRCGNRGLEKHQPLSKLMFLRSTVCRWRKIAMMMARPTAASAAETVITNTTNTCPAVP